jgi:hypothetical protein
MTGTADSDVRACIRRSLDIWKNEGRVQWARVKRSPMGRVLSHRMTGLSNRTLCLFSCQENVRYPVCVFRGGQYRFRMTPPDGEPFHLSVEVLEIDPPWRLLYTFRGEEPAPDDRETVVDLSLLSAGDGTRLVLSQGPFRTEERLALHRNGWSESFEKLQAVLAGRSKPQPHGWPTAAAGRQRRAQPGPPPRRGRLVA